jgi:ABC-type lipoprotein release transport system permease subunit
MRISVSTKYAAFSLFRHVRRTILSVLGIGLGCGICLFMVGFVKGESRMMLQAAAESGNGHLRIVPAGWLKDRDNDLRLPQWKQILQMLRQTKGVEVVTPHARKDALLAFGTRTVGVQIVGVDPDTEQSANRLVRNVTEGKYLTSGESGTTVVGKAITERLNVGLDDELLVTAADNEGQIRSAMLRITGIVETGSYDIDSSICQVNLEDLEKISGLKGVGDLTVLIKKPKELNKIASEVRKKLPKGCALLTWKEIVPGLASGVKIDETWTRLTVMIVMIVVFLGIAGAQLTAVLERRREFAVLSALGMKSIRLVHIMFTEGVVLGLFGGILGLVFGIPSTYYIATNGIDFSAIYGNTDLSVSNILFDPVFKGEFGWWLLPLAFALSFTATILSSLYPAWYASKTDPAVALRVEH